MDFRWNAWNIEHIGRHGVEYPRHIGEDKLLVWGRSAGGELLQVIVVLDEEGSVFVLHARPLTDREKRRYRRQGR